MKKAKAKSNEQPEAEGGGLVVSLQEMADMLGIHRQTMTKYIKQGCPHIRKADQKQGHDWELNTADVFEWTIDRYVMDRIADIADPNEQSLRKRAYVAESKLAKIERREAWYAGNIA